jgi:Uma2 family endonuclease
MYLDVNKIFDEAKESPMAIILYNRLKSHLDEESQKRQAFYEMVKEDQKAEFINGEIIIHSPVKLRHSLASDSLFVLLHTYTSKHELGFCSHEKLMIRLTRNDYEPDLCFFLKETAKDFKQDQMLFPAPDFVVEVLSPSTENTDRTIKMEDYAQHGIKEYWIIDAEAGFVEQYLLKDEKYALHQKSASGNIQSMVIKGLDIPVQAIFDKDVHSETIRRFLS